jgi:hypothetical protein
MGFRPGCFLVWAVALLSPTAVAYEEDSRQFVQRAVQVELAKDAADHTHWIYFETDSKPDRSVKQWVAETREGSLRRVIAINGQPVPEAEQRRKMDNYVNDSWARSKQRKGEQHDDQQATELLNLLPQAFVWTNQGAKGNWIMLHFKPDPQFRPPDLEAKVFASMEGDMAVDKDQLRIASLKGTLIQDVKIAGGFLGRLYAGGTFDVERRETGKAIWQITETHVHIQGHVLIFKTISEQEDDVKTDFKQLPDSTSMEQAEGQLLSERK